MYQDSGRAWINHNGAEIIFDLPKPLVPKTWNTFCYTCRADGQFQIWLNGQTIERNKYKQKIDNFELKSPILLGIKAENAQEKHRFFGEISNLNIWADEEYFDKILDGKDQEIKPDAFEWNLQKNKLVYSEEHISILKEQNTFFQNNDKNIAWVLNNIKSHESGFQDCEKLGGNPLFAYDMDVLKSWDKNQLCEYFWMPLVHQDGKWRERNSKNEIFQV